MKTIVDEALRRDAEFFALRYRCEDCVHFEPDRGRCAEGFPNAGHRDVRIEQTSALEFCKSFELV